jgi:hypothetical protein
MNNNKFIIPKVSRVKDASAVFCKAKPKIMFESVMFTVEIELPLCLPCVLLLFLAHQSR